MLGAEDPLIPVPLDLETYIARALSEDSARDLGSLMSDYFDEFTVRMAGFDTVGTPLIPPDAHVLDHLARAWDLVAEELAARRPSANTVACPVEDLDCDLCGERARYETHVQARGESVLVYACLDCTRKHGDPILGPGASVYLMYMDEVPSAVREICDDIRSQQGQASLWSKSSQPGARLDNALDASPPPSSITEAAPDGDQSTSADDSAQTAPREVPIALDGKTVSVRLRNLWTQVIGPMLEEHDHDLADSWPSAMLRRLGPAVVISSPINFGDGDPFAGALGSTIRDLIAKESGGSITNVSYEYTERRLPKLRRAKTSSLDIYHPEDIAAPDCTTLAQALTSELAGAGAASKAVLACLTVAGASRYRIWLAAPTEADRRAVGSTPGAAADLRIAMGRVQRGGPLYDLVVDPEARDRYQALTLG